MSLERTKECPDGLTDGRLCIAAVAAGYSKQSDLDRAATRRDLLDLLDGAAVAAGLRRPTWRHESAREFAVLRVDEPVRPVVDRFVRELDAELFRYNLTRRPDFRLRMDLSIHCGQPAEELRYALPLGCRGGLGGVVEDEAQRVAEAGADGADAVPRRGG